MMQTTQMDKYGELISEDRFPGGETFSTVNCDNVNCRLTVFDSVLSGNEQFRAAWRRDLGLLRRLPHDGIPAILDSGDEHGIVYVATAAVPDKTLPQYLKSHSFSWDEIADIGWQIASVMQHLHNSGLAHGGLDGGSVRITQQLRVCVVDSGVHRWVLSAGDEVESADISRQCMNDLVSLGHLMQELAVPGRDSQDRASDIPSQWWELISDLADFHSVRFPATAREVQGRLGRILLEDSGDAMNVVAARTSQVHGRQSIVDALLPVALTRPFGGFPKTAVSRRVRWRTLIVFILAIVIATVVVVLM
jgi:serine/threonine protein kinase